MGLNRPMLRSRAYLAASANQHYDRRAAGYSDQGKMELVAPGDYAAFGLPSRLAGRVAPRERQVAQVLRLLRAAAFRCPRESSDHPQLAEDGSPHRVELVVGDAFGHEVDSLRDEQPDGGCLVHDLPVDRRPGRARL